MDKSEPRNRLIAFYSILAVATLAMLKPAFDAYYDQMFESARQDRLTQYDDLVEVRDAEREWQEALGRGPVTIADAMQQIGQRGRTAIPQIAPRADAEMNLDPLRGWAQLPQDVELTGPDPEGAVETEGDALLDTPLEGGEAPPEGTGEGAAEAAELPPGSEVAPGQNPGTEAPGGVGAAGQPGAGGNIPPPVARTPQGEQGSPEGAADPNDGEAE